MRARGGLGTATDAAWLIQRSPSASDAASRCMTHPLVRVARWGFALALMGFAATVSGAATAQFFDPFSQFFAPQAPAFAHPPAYAPPAFYRRGPRHSRRP